MRRRWSLRWSGPGRPMKPRFVRVIPGTMRFAPVDPSGFPLLETDPIYMSYDEYEAFRLIYHEGLNQEKAADRMGVSRGTVWRCLESARSKVASMLVERRLLVLTPSPPRPRRSDEKTPCDKNEAEDRVR